MHDTDPVRDMMRKLRQRRRELGMSQVAVAARMGMQRNAIGKLEKRADPTKTSLSTYSRYAQALGYRIVLLDHDGYLA